LSDNKRYYYLKLKDNFYNTEDIKLLESMQNGYEYSSLYLKLCLLSLKGEGQLLYKNRIPYKAEMLSTITGHSIEVIEYAIPLFVELEMLHVMDNGTLFIDDMQNLIGHGSTEGERKAAYRKKLKNIKLLGHCPDERPPEKEIKKEIKKKKEKEIKKKKEKKKEKEKFSPPTINNIKEYLKEYLKEKDIGIDVELFFDYYESNGWMVGNNKMKDWKATVRNWARRQKDFEKDIPPVVKYEVL